MKVDLATVKKNFHQLNLNYTKERKFLIMWSTRSVGKKKSKADFVHLHFLLPLQPTGYLCKYFTKCNLRNRKKPHVNP